ncbi:MAG: hypothetical protein ACRDCN_12175, partial [Tannerellaceae bacterium]
IPQFFKKQRSLWICFRLPIAPKTQWICFRERTYSNDIHSVLSSHVETCVLLSHKSADDFISVKMEYADDRKIQPDRITYRLIQEYIEEKYGFKVHTANIAEVKRNLGLPMYDAPNAVEELKRPYKPAPEYKVEAIKDALRHFKVID